MFKPLELLKAALLAVGAGRDGPAPDLRIASRRAGLEPGTPKDDAYHFPEYADQPHRFWYTEWWYFNFYEPATGIAGMATFAVFNPGARILPGVSSLTASTITPDGITPVIEYMGMRHFAASTETADLTLADSRLTVIDKDTYRIQVASSNGQVHMDLTFVQADIPQFFIREQHGSYWNVSSWLNYMPSAWVNGTLTVKGKAYPITNATGYHDHDWGMWRVFRETWDWAEVASPEGETVFDVVFHAAFQKSTSYFRYKDLRLYLPQENFKNTQDGWVRWKWFWKYPTQMTFECLDSSGNYLVKMAWTIIDTLPLWQYPIIVFEQTAQFDGGLYEKAADGSWQPVCEIHAAGFAEHSVTWI
jgi:hypothetical protein